MCTTGLHLRNRRDHWPMWCRTARPQSDLTGRPAEPHLEFHAQTRRRGLMSRRPFHRSRALGQVDEPAATPSALECSSRASPHRRLESRAVGGWQFSEVGRPTVSRPMLTMLTHMFQQASSGAAASTDLSGREVMSSGCGHSRFHARADRDIRARHQGPYAPRPLPSR